MNAVAGTVGKVQKSRTLNTVRGRAGGGAQCVSVEEEDGVLQDYREQRGEEKRKFIIL